MNLERLLPRALLTCLLALAAFGGSAAEILVLPEYAGRWVVNEKQSDNVEERMKEMRPMRMRPQDQDMTSGERRAENSGDRGQHPVVEKEDDESSFFGSLFGRHGKPRTPGPMQKLMAVRVIEIVADAKSYLVTYDGALQRHVTPHLGKVYSASGAELVSDDLGETLAYWKDGDLVLETEMKPRGYLVQRFTLAPDHQHMTVKTLIKRFESERENEDAPRLRRVFDRQARTGGAAQ